MHTVTATRSELQATLATLPGAGGAQPAALDDLLAKLGRPQRIYQLLSSRLTVRQVLWCLAQLLADERVGQVPGTDAPRFVWQGAPHTPAPGHGLHLVSDDCLQLNPHFREILADLVSDKQNRYSQSIETYETLVRRYKIMQSLGDLNHEALLLLGDDALFSLFLAVHGYRRQIVVADIDPQLLATIARVAAQQGFDNIEVVHYDVFESLPPSLRGRFDCFAVNGFKDLGGLLMFVGRALQALKAPAAMASGYLNFGSHEVPSAARVQEEAQLYQTLLRFGMYLDYCVPCPETHVGPDFEQAFSASVRRLAQVPPALRLAACAVELQGLYRDFQQLSWVQMANFPDIQLSPLKMGRCRVVERNDREISRFLRLGQFYAGGAVDAR